MQIIRKTSEVAAIPEPAIRDFLAQRIAQMEPDWAPDSWEDYGRFFVLAPGDDIHLLEAENCDHLVCSLFGDARLGDADFTPTWEWADDHGSFYEVAVIFSDVGNFDAIIIPKTGMPAVLLDLCASYASPAA